MRPHVTLPSFSTLSEAVSSGFTFTMVDASYTGLHTPFQCKDYFQDMFWVEHNKQAATVCGFPWTPGQIDPAAPFFTMALRYPGIGSRRAAMRTFIRDFDRPLAFTPTALRSTDNPSIVLLTFDGRWTQSAPLFSALTTIIRLAYIYPLSMTLPEFFAAVSQMSETFRETYKWSGGALYSPVATADISRFRETRPRLERLLAGHIPTLSYHDIPSANHAHGTGIMGSLASTWK